MRDISVLSHLFARLIERGEEKGQSVLLISQNLDTL